MNSVIILDNHYYEKLDNLTSDNIHFREITANNYSIQQSISEEFSIARFFSKNVKLFIKSDIFYNLVPSGIQHGLAKVHEVFMIYIAFLFTRTLFKTK